MQATFVVGSRYGANMGKRYERRSVSLLVTDFDNTLYDWFAVWFASFNAMLDSLIEESGVPADVLKSEIRTVHQSRGTSEYSYLLNEIPSLCRLHPGMDMAKVYGDAIARYRKMRREKLALYPGVRRTLEKVHERGVPIVVYTESLAYHAAYRLRKFNLDGVVTFLYSPADHDFPAGVDPIMLRSMSAEHYELQATTHHHTPTGILKPDPTVLSSIINELGVDPERTVYVGDSLMKDVAMAQRVGAIDVYAQYGVSTHRAEYNLLRQVSHWSERDVERERALAKEDVAAPYLTLDRSFDQLLEEFHFDPWRES